MFERFRKVSYRAALMVIATALVGTALLSTSTPAQAHCDSEQGPVAAAARQALETGDVKLISPYVQPEYEKELSAALKQSVAVRRQGGQSKTLADQYFVETAIRLHRLGEGAPYTGMTDEATPDSIVAADKAMSSGSMTEVNEMLSHAFAEGLEVKYHAVVEARENAEKLGTVEAHRERVEAELMFEKYVYELYTAASSTEALTEGHAH